MVIEILGALGRVCWPFEGAGPQEAMYWKGKGKGVPSSASPYSCADWECSFCVGVSGRLVKTELILYVIVCVQMCAYMFLLNYY